MFIKRFVTPVVVLILLTSFYTVITDSRGVTMEAKGDQKIDIIFDMKNELSVVLTTVYEVNDNDAKELREHIDQNFGNKDGTVEQSESDSYENRRKEDAKNLYETQNTFLGEPLLVLSTTVDVTGAPGSTNSSDPIKTTFVSDLEAQGDTTKDGWIEIQFRGNWYYNNTITVKVFGDWQIAKYTKNFQEESRSSNNQEIKGRAIVEVIDVKADVEIKAYSPSILEKSNSGVPEDEDTNFFSGENSILLIPLILVGIIILLLIIKISRGRSDRKDGIEEDVPVEQRVEESSIDDNNTKKKREKNTDKNTDNSNK